MKKSNIAGLAVSALMLAACDGSTIPDNNLGHLFDNSYELSDIGNEIGRRQSGYFMFYTSTGQAGLILTKDYDSTSTALTDQKNKTHIFEAIPEPAQELINAHMESRASAGDTEFDGTYVFQLSSDTPKFYKTGIFQMVVPDTNIKCNVKSTYADPFETMRCADTPSPT